MDSQISNHFADAEGERIGKVEVKINPCFDAYTSAVLQFVRGESDICRQKAGAVEKFNGLDIQPISEVSGRSWGYA